MSDLLVFVAGVSLSFGLFSLSYQSWLESFFPAELYVFMLGVFMFCGSLGALFGRLYWGTGRGSINGFFLCGIAGFALIFVHFMPAVN